MVATLVGGGEDALVVADDVVLQLAHGLELHAGDLAEGLGGLVQRVLGRRLQRVAVLVEVGAEHRHRRNLCKGIDEGRAETGQHVEVAGTSLDEREKTRTVHSLAAGEYGLQVVQVVDDEVERLQLAVAAGVHEVHHADVVVYDVIDDVGLGQFRRRFLQCRYDEVGIQFQVFVVHNSLKFA